MYSFSLLPPLVLISLDRQHTSWYFFLSHAHQIIFDAFGNKTSLHAISSVRPAYKAYFWANNGEKKTFPVNNLDKSFR